MVFCIIAMVVFGILGIFSAKYRRYAKEAFRCVGRMATLRPCDTAFDQEMKSKITGKIIKYSPRAARFTYKHFTKISWAFVVVMFVSLGYTAYGFYNLVVTGNCDPAHPEQCVFNPQNPNVVECPFKNIEPASGIASIGGFLDIKNYTIEQGKINGKVLIYFIGTTWCPHCLWEKPRFIEATKMFGNWTGLEEGDLSNASYQSNYFIIKTLEMDKANLTQHKEDVEVFNHYSSKGNIPVIIMGGKYFRIGAGEKLGAEQDVRVLVALLCKASNNAVAYCNSDEIQNLSKQLE